MIRYCGRNFSDRELERIRALIAEDADRTRAELSRLTCRMLNWFRPDGGLKDMSCRVAMLRMAEDGLITLPPPGRKPPPQQKIHFTTRTDPQDMITRPVHELVPVQICPLINSDHSKLWVDICSCKLDINHVPVAQMSISTVTTTSDISHCPVRNCATSLPLTNKSLPPSALVPQPGRSRHEIDLSVGATNNAKASCLWWSTMLVF